jgi:hypothetical protein
MNISELGADAALKSNLGIMDLIPSPLQKAIRLITGSPFGFASDIADCPE